MTSHDQLPVAPVACAPVRLYLCGPMTGLPESNYPAFNRAAAELRAMGCEVRNPAELEAPLAWAHRRGAESVGWDDWVRVALALMLQCDGLCLLPGWEGSRGACLERDVAWRMGWQVYTLEQVLTGEIDGGWAMNHADIPAQPLKAKQRRLLDVFRRLGPITIKRAALEIHGDTSDAHVKMIHNQMPALASRRMVTPAGVADPVPGVRGVRPLLWRACA